jgi:hypothetical protein
MVAKPARKSVAIVVPPNAQSLDVSGPLDAFLEANRQSSARALYEVRLVATFATRNAARGRRVARSRVPALVCYSCLTRAPPPHFSNWLPTGAGRTKPLYPVYSNDLTSHRTNARSEVCQDRTRRRLAIVWCRS